MNKRLKEYGGIEITHAGMLFDYAHAYARSGISLAGRVKLRHADAPVRFLFAHATELYLKSFLMLHGETSASILKFGHNFTKMIVTCRNAGLVLTDREANMIRAYDYAEDDRYNQSGARPILTVEQMIHLCDILHSAVSPGVLEKHPRKDEMPPFA